MKVAIIGKYKNFMLSALQVVLQCFEDINNSQKLNNMSFVSGFSRNHFTWEVDYKMPLI